VLGDNVGHLSQLELEQLRGVGPILLKRDDFPVRQEAAKVLAKFGDADSLGHLRVALAGEELDDYRDIIAQAIKALELRLAAEEKK